MARALLIWNPRARAGEKAATIAAGALRSAGWLVEAERSGHRNDLRGLARAGVSASCDVVVAVGGDGTVTEVASGLVGTGVPLGIIPAGAGNLVAGNLGIPTGRRAAEALLTGRPRTVDLGQITMAGTQGYFAVACGVGFDARVMAATPSAQKRRWGKLAYVATALRLAPLMANVPHVITLDGVRREVSAAQVFVANLGRLARGVSPRLPILADDGLLDVVILRAHGPVRGFLAGWEAIQYPRIGEHPGGRLSRTRAREVHIEAALAQPIELDGTCVGTTPFTARAVPNAISIVVPAR